MNVICHAQCVFGNGTFCNRRYLVINENGTCGVWTFPNGMRRPAPKEDVDEYDWNVRCGQNEEIVDKSEIEQIEERDSGETRTDEDITETAVGDGV